MGSLLKMWVFESLLQEILNRFGEKWRWVLFFTELQTILMQVVEADTLILGKKATTHDSEDYFF